MLYIEKGCPCLENVKAPRFWIAANHGRSSTRVNPGAQLLHFTPRVISESTPKEATHGNSSPHRLYH